MRKLLLKSSLLAPLAVCGLAYGQVDSQTGMSNPFMGKAGVAGPASIDAVKYNPATAGEVSQTEVQLIWGFKSVDYSQRYPGFEAKSKSSSGLDPGFPIPKFVYKRSRKIGIGGLIIPFPVSQDINVTDIPIVILGQQYPVDIKGEGSLNLMADISIGYAASSTFSAGLHLLYLSFQGAGDLLDSSSGGSIASFSIASDIISIGAGIKMSVGNLTIGVSSTVFGTNSTKSSFDSDLKAVQAEEESGGGGDTSTSTSTFLNPIRFGIAAKVISKITILADMEYTRADRSQTRFSTVDFTEKQADVYDTLALFFGGEFRVNSKVAAMVGYFNEPGSIGPGSKGKNGKAGFGFMDLALNLGEPPAKPVWGFGSGVRFQFKKMGKKKRRVRYKMAVEGGIVYSETSIGIDDTGEQPGAYLVRRYQFPLKFIYRL